MVLTAKETDFLIGGNVCLLKCKLGTLQRGQRGIFVMRNQLILFSVKREFGKLFFVILNLNVLRDPRRT